MSGLRTISESKDGKRRQTVHYVGDGRGRRSITRHEVRIGTSDWAHKPPAVALGPWPAGKNFLRREE